MSHRDIVLGPIRLSEGVLTMHTPRNEDGAAWSRARLDNRAWLERAFPAWGDDWEAEQSTLAWVERCSRLRAARRANVRPFVLRLDGRLIGELGIDAVTDGGRVGEASVWMVAAHGSPAVMHAASLLLMQHAFTAEAAFDLVLSPVPVAAREGRSRGLEAVGFARGPVVQRTMGGAVVDLDMWQVQNSPEVRERIAEQLGRLVHEGPAVALDRSPIGVRRDRARAQVRRSRQALVVRRSVQV